MCTSQQGPTEVILKETASDSLIEAHKRYWDVTGPRAIGVKEKLLECLEEFEGLVGSEVFTLLGSGTKKAGYYIGWYSQLPLTFEEAVRILAGRTKGYEILLDVLQRNDGTSHEFRALMVIENTLRVELSRKMIVLLLRLYREG